MDCSKGCSSENSAVHGSKTNGRNTNLAYNCKLHCLCRGIKDIMDSVNDMLMQ